MLSLKFLFSSEKILAVSPCTRPVLNHATPACLAMLPENRTDFTQAPA